MAVIVDRLEGEYAVLLEGDKTIEVLRIALAEGVQEADAVVLGEDGIWRKDVAATEQRKERIAKKMNALWE